MNETDPPRLLLSIGEAAAALNLGRTTIYGLIGTGEIPVVRVGKAVRVPVERLRVWIKEHEEVKTDGT